MEEKLSLRNYIQFLKDFNIVGLGLGFLVGSSTAELAKDFNKTILGPLVEPLIKTITGPNMTLKVAGATLEIGSFLKNILSFAITMIIVYLLIRGMAVQISKPVSFVKVVNLGELQQAENETEETE